MHHYLVLIEGPFGGTRKKLFNTLDEAVIYSMTFTALTEVYKLTVGRNSHTTPEQNTASDCSMERIGMNLYKDKEDNIRDYRNRIIIPNSNNE